MRSVRSFSTALGSGSQSIKRIAISLPAIVLVGVALLNAGLLGTVNAASYLDGEVKYEGVMTYGQEADNDDGANDGVCHEIIGEGDVGAEIPCYLTQDDDVSEALPIGFNFSFYGDTYTEAFANVNGVLHFDCPSSEYTNDDGLPTNFGGDCIDGDPGIVPSSILAFWDDVITAPKNLYCGDEDYVEGEPCTDFDWEGNYPTIVYKTIGTAGSRKFIMQWTNMYLFDSPNIPVGNFQVILYEGSNNIQIQYRNLYGNPERSSGSDATIGIQKNLSTYSQYSHLGTNPVNQGMAIRYAPNGSGGYQAANDEATYDPVFLTIPGAPGEPALTKPTDTATNVARRPLIQWNASTSETADSYFLSISTTPDFSDIVAQATTTSTSYTPSRALQPYTTYYWLVKAQNDLGETFSTIDSFTTGAHIFDEATPTGGDIDTDGVDDRLEDAAPNNGDANENGIPDAEERNVVSFPNAQKDNKYAVIELDDQCAITTAAAQAGSALSTKDTAYDYPAGMLNFSADCGEAGYTTDVTIYQYGLAKGSLVLRKHNPSTKAYSTVSGAVIEEATTNGQSLLKATYQVTDGGALDVDGLVDGIIVDPAGFGQVTVGVPNTGFSKR